MKTRIPFPNVKDPDREARLVLSNLIYLLKRTKVIHMFFPITSREMQHFINKMKRGY